MKQESLNLKAESSWHYSLSDAECESEDKLKILVDSSIAIAISQGGVHVGGSSSGYERQHNKDTDKYKCTVHVTLYFVYPDNKA